MQAKGKILKTFSSFIPNKNISLQNKVTKKMENPRCILNIITEVWHHKEVASGQNNV